MAIQQGMQVKVQTDAAQAIRDQVQTERVNAAGREAQQPQSLPDGSGDYGRMGGMGGMGAMKGASQGFSDNGARGMPRKAMKAKAPPTTLEQVPIPEPLDVQLDRGEARLRVLFVLRELPNSGPADAAIVAKERAGKADAAKAAVKAVESKPAAASPVQPTAPANQPGPAPAQRDAK